MKNLGQLMKQAQAMQEKMAEMQEKVAQVEVDGVAGGGMVTVTLNGKGVLKRLKVDPTLIDPAEPEMLEDLIVAAHADAKSRVDARVAEEMQNVTGGLQLPPASSCRSDVAAPRPEAPEARLMLSLSKHECHGFRSARRNAPRHPSTGSG